MELIKKFIKNFMAYIYYLQICYNYNKNKYIGLVKKSMNFMIYIRYFQFLIIINRQS